MFLEHKRNNWMFYRNPEGARASATVYTIVETTEADNIILFIDT